MKKVNLFEQFANEANVKKEAKMVADQVIGNIQDQYYDEGYYSEDEVYYSLKNYFNSFEKWYTDIQVRLTSPIRGN